MSDVICAKCGKPIPLPIREIAIEDGKPYCAVCVPEGYDRNADYYDFPGEVEPT